MPYAKRRVLWAIACRWGGALAAMNRGFLSKMDFVNFKFKISRIYFEV